MLATATDSALLRLTELARLLGCCAESVRDWRQHGMVPRGGGERVKLRAVRVGSIFKTCLGWYREFQEALDSIAPPGPTPTQRKRQVEKDKEAWEAAAGEGYRGRQGRQDAL
jgi:hypothetical protein